MTRKLRNYTEDEVVRLLNKKTDCFVHGGMIHVHSNKSEKDGHTIDNPEKKNDLGNTSWGRIDYLKKVHGYKVVRISSIEALKASLRKAKLL